MQVAAWWTWMLGVSVTVTVTASVTASAAVGFHGDTQALRFQPPRRQTRDVVMVEPARYRAEPPGSRAELQGSRQETAVWSSGKAISATTVVLASLVTSTSLVLCVWFAAKARLQCSRKLRMNLSVPKPQCFRRCLGAIRRLRQDTGNDDDDDDDSSFYTDVAVAPDDCLTQAAVSPTCHAASVSGGPDYTDVAFPGVRDYTEVTLSPGPHYADVQVVSGSRGSDNAAAGLSSKGSRVLFVRDYSEVKDVSSDRVGISGRPEYAEVYKPHHGGRMDTLGTPEYTEVYKPHHGSRMDTLGTPEYTEVYKPHYGSRMDTLGTPEYTEVYKPHHGGRVVMLDDREYTEVDVSPVDGRVFVPGGYDYTDVMVSRGNGQMLMSGGHEYTEVELSRTDDYTEVVVPPEDCRVVMSGALENRGVGLFRAMAGVDVPDDLHYAEACVTDVRTGAATQGPEQYSHLEKCAPRGTLQGVPRAYNHVVVVRARHQACDDRGQAAGVVKLTSDTEYDVSSVTSEGCRVKVIAQQYDTLNKQFPPGPANT
ncbi:uncharacterized protein LOC112557766 isoform X2 [Pomacea canaliculata]|uniref:uncharacterized protein LOC112557766 isoform X2 n=1 Tax=Pomacea canaliculata TaxID=400727 RepID=UPI000D733BA6|nr:uncharacterized protein LOC112557766 isoform X2 [Pomacea canaliculata]